MRVRKAGVIKANLADQIKFAYQVGSLNDTILFPAEGAA
jgi:hypothetical protein